MKKVADLISDAIKNANSKECSNYSSVETKHGKIICEVEFAMSRTKPKGWYRKAFYIVKPGAEFRSRFSLKKAQDILG